MRIVKNKKINEIFEDKIKFFNDNVKKELETKLKKITGLSFNVKAYPSRNKEAILIKDDTNLISKIGPFGAALKDIYISGDIWFNDIANEASGSMDFTYTSKSGGSNGLTLIQFYYEGNKLIFTDAARKTI